MGVCPMDLMGPMGPLGSVWVCEIKFTPISSIEIQLTPKKIK